MFGSKKKSTAVPSGQTTLVGAGTELFGELQFSGAVEVQGLVKGNLLANPDAEDASVTILPGGRVEGDIVAPTVVVHSTVEGNIFAGKRIELAAGAEVCGDVHYQVIEMMQGAQVNGNLLYSPAGKNAVGEDQPAEAVYAGLSGAAKEPASKKSAAKKQAQSTGKVAENTGPVGSGEGAAKPAAETRTADKQSALL